MDFSSLAASLQAPNVTNPNLIVDLSATVQNTPGLKFQLPQLGYEQQFTFDILDGTSNSTDPNLFVNGVPVDTNDPEAAATSVAVGVLKGAGVDVIDQLSQVIPPQVADVLLGKTVIFGNYTLADLIQEDPTGTFKTPIDLLQIVGVPGPVCHVLDAILNIISVENELKSGDPAQQRDAVNQLNAQDPNNPPPPDFVPKQTSAIQFTYFGQDKTTLVSDIIKIFEGQPVQLVGLKVDLTQDQDVSDAVAAAAAVSQATGQPPVLYIQQRTNSAGGTTNYLVGNVDIDSDQIISNLTTGLGSNADKLLKWAVKFVAGGLDFGFHGDLAMAAALNMGVDTTFLLPSTTGTPVQKVEKSIFVSSGNIIDFQFNASAHISASVLGPAQGVLGQAVQGFQNLGGTAAQGVHDLEDGLSASTSGIPGLSLTDTGVPALDALEDLAGHASASLDLHGQFLFGLHDPNGDGRLTLLEILNTPLSDLFAFKGSLIVGASGDASIGGVHFSFSIPDTQLIGFEHGYEPAPGGDGPSSANFANNSNQPQAVPQKVFAEVVDNVLQVYGSSSSDVINLEGGSNGTVVVVWNQ